ncbi:hypothetical protein C1Y08_05680 [Pseudomonas sp. FW306-02-F02-AA]|uniref:Uncharacterized protein n=1 Tax=Pseudomonas fluorescens TaxID=294 RepID=A0A0N7GZQ3_PSEFL|nr:hypothetical protein AO353_07910 [Pseudomonas fluorescens]PMZ02528.1 hypothetical protein C1Y07_19120 [Pseudomonas sp. FW306-02-F02-AB]PMZ09995.1 hypothetical protein C1Y06_11860 [Pseudomonas sp. FW306-02-H06C]PMZ16698.1 hypothetical protein C1Y08_05680 [Pseudomonas sp. FW306-02-F02-AA]PMZ23627.1 hypothetical protein C1Y09_02255 [Pseudomonas sp. FW306-02-F08-AA]PMZ28497.1 hypothetical protein C1Y05_06505 [Pseudomonas sp. FW306-02-F04-BA]PMZ30736.1 hypothetical protein C1X99_29855 [Pseudomo
MENAPKLTVDLERDDLIVLETKSKEIIFARYIDSTPLLFSVQDLSTKQNRTVPRDSVTRVRTALVKSNVKNLSSVRAPALYENHVLIGG